MTAKQKWLRFGTGVILVIATLVISFSFLNQWIINWGSSKAEQEIVYPGDDLSPTPLLTWTHGITIDATPEKVWPWVAQIGESRGAFYSYTFIENMVTGHRSYINTNRILPEYQDPQPGTPIIAGMLNWKEIKTGEWIMAEDNIPDLGWTWLWYLQPHGEQTRMLIRMRIQTPPGMGGSEAVKFILNLGGFVMERDMLEGVHDRSEGIFEPLWIEYAEIMIWLAALICGIMAAVKYINRKDWRFPLGLGLTVLATLIWFTFGQPVVWLRVVVDLVLVSGVFWLYRKG